MKQKSRAIVDGVVARSKSVKNKEQNVGMIGWQVQAHPQRNPAREQFESKTGAKQNGCVCYMRISFVYLAMQCCTETFSYILRLCRNPDTQQPTNQPNRPTFTTGWESSRPSMRDMAVGVVCDLRAKRAAASAP